jgi:hypothetical protein
VAGALALAPWSPCDKLADVILRLGRGGCRDFGKNSPPAERRRQSLTYVWAALGRAVLLGHASSAVLEQIPSFRLQIIIIYLLRSIVL